MQHTATATHQAADYAARLADMPLVGVEMEVRNFSRAAVDVANSADAPAATFEMVFSTGAPVTRYDWANGRYYQEVLDVSAKAIDLSRLERGAPLLNTHSAYNLEDQIGVVDQPRVSGGQGTVQAQMSRRDSVRGIVMDMEDRVIRNVSVGYRRDAMAMAQDTKTGAWTYTVTRWTPMEVSLVPIPADMDSQVRSDGGKLKDASGQDLRAYPCELVLTPTVGAPAAITPRKEIFMSEETGGANQATASQDAVLAARQAEVQRSADIIELCQRHSVPKLAADLIRKGGTLDEAKSAVLAELAIRDASSGGQRNAANIVTVKDEMETRMAGMAQAIAARVDGKVKLDDNGRQYRGLSLLEMGREFLEAKGVNTRGLDRLTLATRMLHYRDTGSMGTSDFSSLLANVASKRLRDSYQQNPGTYQQWARRAPNAPDFKSMSVVALSGAPDLLQVNEHGEFKVGTMSDGQETYKLLTYGRIVSLTRQAVINDDLSGFDRLVSSFGNSSARLENRTVYSQLTANAALSDGVALFNATHSNLAGTGAAIAVASLGAARTAMRLQKGMAGEELNITPTFLIVPAALEQVAYQFTSSNYVAATQSAISEFRAGGRTAITPIVEPVLDANSSTAWYLASDSSQVDTIEYCYLDGAEGPVLESELGFEVDGISYKCRLDFASKAIDYRGLYRNPGA